MQKFAHPLREREGKYTLGKAGPAAYARLAGVWAVPQAPFEEFRFHFLWHQATMECAESKGLRVTSHPRCTSTTRM